MSTLPNPDTDPAGYLGGVARLMRERAEAATPGPWFAANEHDLLGPAADPAWCVSRMQPGYESMSEEEGYMYDVAETSLGGRRESEGPDAEFIASWHPAVALAVADWLEAEAKNWNRFAAQAAAINILLATADEQIEARVGLGFHTGSEALATARAYMEGQP